MVSRTTLSSHPISCLKNEIRKQNISRHSKLKKTEVVELMLRHKSRFKHIKHNFNKKEESKKEAPMMSAERKRELIEKDKARREKTKPKTPVQPEKKRIAPTMIQTATKLGPMRGGGCGSQWDETLKRLEKEGRAMDASAKGKKLVSNSPVAKSREPKTKGNHRTGRNFAKASDCA